MDTDAMRFLPVGLRRDGPSLPLLEALAWYVREGLRIERLLNAVTVKRRRNLARPVRRRRSAFRDPAIALDFLVMAWLGVTRLSQIARHLRGRDDLAQVFGLPRFCDHTTAHNFLNGFHRTHVAQLVGVNARLLREHGGAEAWRGAVVDIDVAQRGVRRTGRRRDLLYRWAVAFSGGEVIAQDLDARASGWTPVVVRALSRAREQVGTRPRLVRVAGTAASRDLLRSLVRERVPFLTTGTWAWALAQRGEPRGAVQWTQLDAATRALDLGAAPGWPDARTAFRTILTERRSAARRAGRERIAAVTSLLDEPLPAIVQLAASGGRIRDFFGHPRWPLGDGKMPSGDARGNAAYAWLATLAMNILRLFARHLGEGWTPWRVHEELRVVPWATERRASVARARPGLLR